MSASLLGANEIRELAAELDAIALEDDFYHVAGDTVNGGVVISKFADRIETESRFDRLDRKIGALVARPID